MNVPPSRVSTGTTSYGYTVPRRLARSAFWAYSSSVGSGAVGGSATESVTPTPGWCDTLRARLRSSPSGGKTRTLQGLAEQLAAKGVPVFAADIKGDLSGVATPGEPNEKLLARTQAIGQDWRPRHPSPSTTRSAASARAFRCARRSAASGRCC